MTLCYILKPHITSFIRETHEVSFKKPSHKQNDRQSFGFRSTVPEDSFLLSYDAVSVGNWIPKF
jgi:hypothetical protein